jgi:hypothetical protein
VVVVEGPVDPVESLRGLVRRLEAVHRLEPRNGVIARELRQAVVALASLAPAERGDPLAELAAMVREVP